MVMKAMGNYRNKKKEMRPGNFQMCLEMGVPRKYIKAGLEGQLPQAQGETQRHISSRYKVDKGKGRRERDRGGGQRV